MEPAKKRRAIKGRKQIKVPRKSGNKSGRDTRNYEVRMKERLALQLRTSGATYEDIAEQLGYASHSGVRVAINRALARIGREESQELHALELARCNEMLMSLWVKVQKGDESAINTALRVMDKIEALEGVKPAEDINLNVTHRNATVIIDAKVDEKNFIQAMRAARGELPSAEQGDLQEAIVDAEIIEDAENPISA